MFHLDGVCSHPDAVGYWLLAKRTGEMSDTVGSGHLVVERTVMAKMILELLALKWLWDRRKGRR